MADDNTYDSIFLARQPILDIDNDTWGYMLLFRDSGSADSAIFSSHSDATMNLVANLPLCGGVPDSGIRMLAHFTPEDIVKGTPYAMPCKHTIVLEEMADPGEDVVIAVSDLIIDGYSLAINNYEGRPGGERLADLADTLIVDMHGKSSGDLAAIVARSKTLGISSLIAKRVETKADLALAKSAGFSLFNGYYFKRPQTEGGRKIRSSKVARLKLFEIIQRDEPDFDALTPAIEADVAISYRLLSFLNTASFCFATKVTSIKQAVVLAGWKPIRNWLRLIILTDLPPAEKTKELAYTSAHRAKLFETAALGSGYEDESDRLFLIGLFSLLDVLLGISMEEVTALLPVDEETKNTLCGKKTKYTPWLELAKAIEKSDWDKVCEQSKRLNILPGTVAVSYQHAFSWADAFFAARPGG